MDNYNKMYKIASSIYKLHEEMASLEVRGMINSFEYNKLLEYLEICLEYEDRLYSFIDLINLSNILAIINEDDSCVYDKLNVFRKHDCINNRIVNKLFSVNRLLASENDKNDEDESFKLLYIKNDIMNVIQEEFIYYFLFILSEYINKYKSNDIKSKLINAKYRLSFMNSTIENAMHTTNYRLDIPVIRCNFSLNESLIDNIDLYNYVKETFGESIFNNEIKNILNDNNDISLILHQCALRSSMMMIDDDNRLADLNDMFHKYIEDNGDNNKNEDDIIKCFRKIKSDREKQFSFVR